MFCDWEDNRRSGVAYHASQTLYLCLYIPDAGRNATLRNSAVFDSKFVNDGVGLHACISTWEYYCSVYPIQSTKHFCAAWVPIFHWLRMRLHFCRHCACAVSRELCVRWGKFFPRIWNRRPRFAYSLSNLYGCTIKINWVIPQNNVWPCVKDHIWLSAHAQNHVSLEWDGKSVTTIVLNFSTITISY